MPPSTCIVHARTDARVTVAAVIHGEKGADALFSKLHQCATAVQVALKVRSTKLRGRGQMLHLAWHWSAYRSTTCCRRTSCITIRNKYIIINLSELASGHHGAALGRMRKAVHTQSCSRTAPWRCCASHSGCQIGCSPLGAALHLPVVA